MPTVLFLHGWRFFFYANESNEPPHIHCKKGSQEAKFWLLQDAFDIKQEFGFQLSAADERFLRQTIFSHFDYIVQEWEEFKRRANS